MINTNANVSLRNKLREKRRNLTDTQKNAAAKNCLMQFLTLPDMATIQHIAFYQAFDGEIDPALLIDYCWQHKKQCYLPVISKNNVLHFFPYSKESQLIKNQFHILEPSQSDKTLEMAANDLDLIVLPCVAFESHGHRLGMGKGYYDKTLYETINNRKSQKPFLLGLAYDFQKVETITTHEKDVKLDGVVTEKELIIF